jgi:hemerythrin-like domain-containing protein
MMEVDARDCGHRHTSHSLGHSKEALMNALEILKQMHEEAKAAFQKLEQASPEERGALWAKLRPELTAHEQMEERFVYDPAVQQVGGRDPLIPARHELHEQQVKQATSMMDQIGELDSRDARFIEMVKQLHQTLGQHIEMEENEFWPHIRQAWGSEKLEEAGGKVQAAKTAATAGAAMSGAAGAASDAIRHIGD